MHRNTALFLLLLAYILSYLDRTLISVLAVPIKQDLQLTDTQLGLLAGLPFVIFYVGLGVPVAWLADRWSRVRIVAIAVALWSLFTAACGLTQNFWQLTFARMGVGIGEAGGSAPSISLITDLFPPESRARAIAIFMFGLPIGTASGIIFGGWIASNIDWRAAFIVIGLIGLPLALLIRLMIKDPPRGGTDAGGGGGEELAPSAGATARVLAGTPSFWLISLAGAASAVPIMGLAFWLPSYFARGVGLSLIQIAYIYGPIVFFGGISGMWLGGWVGDRLGSARPAAYGWVVAASYFLAGPLYALFLIIPNLTLALAVFVLAQAIGYVALSPALACIQNIVPANMRSTATAGYSFMMNLVGMGFGNVFFGWLSDRMSEGYGQDSIRYSMLIGLSFYLVGAVLAALAAKRLDKDWYLRPSAADVGAASG